MGQNNTNGGSCKTVCWLAALIAGVLVAALLMSMRDFGFLGAVFWGLVVLLVGGFVLNWAFCGKAEAQVSSVPAASRTDGATAAAPLASSGAVTTSSPVAENAGAAAASLSPAAASTAPEVKPAAKKPAAKKAATTKTAAKSATKADATAKAAPKAKAEPKAKAAAKPKAKAADAKPAAKAKAAPKAKAATAKPATKAAPKAKAATAAKAKPVAADGKPELLKQARAGGADDLKQIKGVGPKLEGELHKMGVYHFDQVASWRKKEVEWADNNIDGIRNRASRDEWVKQAKILAKGGETEFSKKVKKGGVY
ncbi:putative flap endonuclease-1-like 5' DNA nuclease [Litoreibacter halocynthiae]|uniref:Putative flap endonuclease-1-like 5' DNA nuclease n=1 Tax=Litoreibacter halocynthiae TaxID=1242689 RepID=A0A4R7LGT2_9RHOB|nr:NADH:quinone oxidoreductase [Litoreibacter halocynthiae]TDT74947.1 putative flap endonuclease-1-like 5' DNA nuclease [Litoreibacter halocynthiae]